MFSGYQNKKKQKETANAFEKLSKSAWKSTERLESLTRSKDPGYDQQETDVHNLSIKPRPKSFVMLSPSPSTYPADARKSKSINNGKYLKTLYLEEFCIDKRSLNSTSITDDKMHFNDFGTTQLEEYITQKAKEVGISLDTSQLSSDEELETLQSILRQISNKMNEGYSQKINKESEKTSAANKELKILNDDAAWIEDTCNQITQKLQQLENELESEQMLQVNLSQLKEDLESVANNILKPTDDTWRPKLDELCQVIKVDSQQIRNNIHHICKMFMGTSWEKELRKRAEKCFDGGDKAAFQRMKFNYTTLFQLFFPAHSCSDEFVIACSRLAKFYVFPPPSPKHSELSSAPEIASPTTENPKPDLPCTLVSKLLPPLHFNSRQLGDRFLFDIQQATKYFQTDSLYLYKSYDEHRTTKGHGTCSCILCQNSTQHKHSPSQCNFCLVHQYHNRKSERDKEFCSCGNCNHFSNYLRGLRFLTNDFSDGTKYTPSRSGSFQEQPFVKEKKTFNKLIGGLLFDNNNSSGNSNKKR
ncbi:hypothetical protein [Parasitella parasitica]|uniref:Uncharacterized protein n=1 Tax=Parasitella parasitica TaxID=35722 RepID=A0A0B7NQ67_9FUNG|nr:hypothetical protein [Parasitella parasitica]